MAKSSKPAASKTGGEKNSAKSPAKSPTKAAAKKSKSPAASAGAPGLDTSLAAAAAVRSLLAKLPSKSDSATPQPPRSESAFFKQFKSGIAKPAGQAMSNLLDKHGGPMQKNTHEGFGSGGPVTGKNQTFGADVNRTGVPRRTGGG